MSSLPRYNQERFANIYALHGGKWSPERICVESGYGVNTRDKRYYKTCMERLLNNPAIAARIEEIRSGYNLNVTEATVSNAVENYLIKTIYMDPTDVFKLIKGRTKAGQETQRYLLKHNSYDQIPRDIRARIEGFDANGNPKFVSKTKCIELWLKMKGMDKNNLDITNLVQILREGGLVPSQDFDEYDDWRDLPPEDVSIRTDYASGLRLNGTEDTDTDDYIMSEFEKTVDGTGISMKDLGGFGGKCSESEDKPNEI